MITQVKYWLAASATIVCGLLYAQTHSLKGAWHVTNVQGLPNGTTLIYLMSDAYFASAVFNEPNKQFIGILGGTYRIEDNKIMAVLEFNSTDSSTVGTSRTFTFQLNPNGNTMQVSSPEGVAQTWERIDEGATPLTGLWRFAGRVDAEGKETRSQRSARKTIKLLTGGYFVWAAINTDTKQFFGCGGGTYTAQNGKYTENIKFFSRDNSRVGMSLTFDFELKNNEWHHKGKNSRGEPLYEIWAAE
ncbi:MAG: membrane or secreted protein [Cytophagales bacterium]|nr:membrane or secreted protein [Bernardetiaceae bacterium]MDW8204963.1 membrane or secreted protein [Cytophagales bacterium]